jgi:hypothetical protein
MDAYKPIVAWLALLLVACGGGGDDGSASCSPAPSINSTPPTSAGVGEQYHYFVEWTVACIPFITSCGFELVQAPPGAGVDPIRRAVYWTPSPSDANSAVTFAIATSSDLCGHRATQSWIVIVSP